MTQTCCSVARVTQCKYKRIGCPWQGPFHELPAHESECSHPTKTGTELMGILGEMDQSHRRDMQLYNTIFSLLCYEKIGFTGTYTTITVRRNVDPLLLLYIPDALQYINSFFYPSHMRLYSSPFNVSIQRCSSGRTALMTS